jgi:hypothetical protein
VRFLIFVQLDQTAESEGIRSALTGTLRRTLETIASGIQDTTGTDIEGAELVAHTMVGLFVAAALRRSIDPHGTDLDQLWAEMRRIVWLSVAARMSASFRGEEGSR